MISQKTINLVVRKSEGPEKVHLGETYMLLIMACLNTLVVQFSRETESKKMLSVLSFIVIWCRLFIANFQPIGSALIRAKY